MDIKLRFPHSLINNVVFEKTTSPTRVLVNTLLKNFFLFRFPITVKFRPAFLNLVLEHLKIDPDDMSYRFITQFKMSSHFHVNILVFVFFFSHAVLLSIVLTIMLFSCSKVDPLVILRC